MARSGIVQPDVFSYKSPNPLQVYGESVVDRGLVVRDATNGYGLLTFGLVWEQYQIWADKDYLANISTSWTAAAGASITTVWTAYQMGDYTP